jgi:putative endonuclease
MPKPCCYILFSQKLNRFYIGATADSIENRIEKHLDKTFGNQVFSAKANDWQVFLTIPFDTFDHAVRAEQHIKRMKSSVYVRNLAKYPEMVESLRFKTCKP